jgi:hypothetical protein
MRRVVLAVAACVAAAGCGGSGSSPSSTDSTAPAAPAAAAGTTAARPSARDIADRCGAQSAGDPSKLIVCLASSGVQLGAGVELHSCLQAAGNSKAVIACVRRAVH